MSGRMVLKAAVYTVVGSIAT